MRRFIPCAWISVAATLLCACGGRPDDQLVLKIAHVLPAGHPTTMALEHFEQHLEERSGQRIEVRLFPNSQLGASGELIVSVKGGNVEGAVVSAAPLAQHVEELNAVVMPFVFRDDGHQAAVLGGEVGRELVGFLAAKGFGVGAWLAAGSRNIMTKRGPIRTPADLGGMKIRVMDSRALRDAVERLGASATPMSQGEVYSALDRGVIDGWENNPPTCLNFSMHETGCKYFAWTRHVAIPDVLILNPGWVAALPAELRAILDESLAELERGQRELWREEERAAVEQLAAQGMLFNEVDESAFRAPFADFYGGYVVQYGDDFGRLLGMIRSGGDAR